ncbi:MAG: metallophosphoesterase family protein [Salinigranum sp.]
MTVTLAILGDTHIPSRTSSVPAWVRERVRDADHVVHAGDFSSLEAYRRVDDLAGGELTAVSGNDDPPELDLPAVDTFERGGVEFVLTHGTGGTEGYERRILEVVGAHGSADAVGVSGHTHEPLDAFVGGHRLLNPGSATGAHPASEPTMMTATVEDGDLAVSLRRESDETAATD